MKRFFALFLLLSLLCLWGCGKPAEQTVPTTEATQVTASSDVPHMAYTAEDYLARGGTGFFVVGAAHIIGEGACAELLAQRGYSVERIG